MTDKKKAIIKGSISIIGIGVIVVMSGAFALEKEVIIKEPTFKITKEEEKIIKKDKGITMSDFLVIKKVIRNTKDKKIVQGGLEINVRDDKGKSIKIYKAKKIKKIN